MDVPEFPLPEWGVVAQMGRNEHAGKIDVGLVCGRRMIRVRKYRPVVEGQPDEPFDTVLISSESLYGIGTADEQACREMYRIREYLPQLSPPSSETKRPVDDDDSDDDEPYASPIEEDTTDAHALLDRIGVNDELIAEGEIDLRVNELVQRYDALRKVYEFVDDELDKHWISLNITPFMEDQDLQEAIRLVGSDHPKLVDFQRMITRFRAVLEDAKQRTPPNRNSDPKTPA
jgi:hypothetical protein